ncbi:MAG: HYC_CC_PP family protein [Mucilaginibacter sp.]
MIKKLFVTFLAVLYLGVSSGATLHYQYCMGRLIKVSIWHNYHGKCHTCGMPLREKASKKCCTDKHQQLKSDKSGVITYSHLTLGTSAVALPSIPSYGSIGCRPLFQTVLYQVSKAPPSAIARPFFLLNCNFRI